MTDSVADRKKNYPTSLRLRSVDVLALRCLARRDAHENVSAAVRKLIDQRMRSEIGREWERVIEEQSVSVLEEAVA